MKRLRPWFVLVSLSLASVAAAALSPGPSVVTPVFTTKVPLVADIDRDGLSDFVLDRSYLRNEGGGIFVERDLGLAPAAGLNGGDAVIGLLDVNGDGRTDLLTNDRPTAPPGVDKGARTYRLYIAGEQLPYPAPIELGKKLRPYIVDANGDGKDDLILATAIHLNRYQSPDEWRVLISRGDGTFETRQTFRVESFPQGVDGHRLLARDINHDGLPDLVVRTANGIEVLRGTGNGDFAPADVRYAPNRYFGGWSMELADLDGDSHLDILLAGFRMVRVFFGDGTGRFPRFSSADIAPLREVPGLGIFNNPKNLVTGHFVRHGRTEIAVDTPEGDVVVLGYEQGKLREVSRTTTEFTRIDLAIGRFRDAGRNELYVNGHYTPEGLRPPPPRLYQIDALASAAAATPIFGGRSRAVRGTASPTLNLDVQMSGACAPSGTTRWSLQREGAFGFDSQSDQVVQTIMDDGAIVFRAYVPWSWLPVTGRLAPKGSRRYEGRGFAETACGAVEVEFTATER